MTSSSSFENQQMASLLTGIFKSAVPPASAPTPPTTVPTGATSLSQEVPITPCVPGVVYPLPGGKTYCFKTLESGQTLNVEFCFPTRAFEVDFIVCVKVVISRKPSNLPNNPNPYVLQISGANWWNGFKNLKCTVGGSVVDPKTGRTTIKYSCTSSEWSGARDICFEADGMGGILMTYCDSRPMPDFLTPYFPMMRPIPPNTEPKPGPYYLPFFIDPEMTKPKKPGYIPKEMIPPTSAPPIAPTPQPKKKVVFPTNLSPQQVEKL